MFDGTEGVVEVSNYYTFTYTSTNWAIFRRKVLSLVQFPNVQNRSHHFRFMHNYSKTRLVSVNFPTDLL